MTSLTRNSFLSSAVGFLIMVAWTVAGTVVEERIAAATVIRDIGDRG